ncbi:hypothetical protein DASC09_025800 [Saccharomycopsis crataegensis]|uniref:Skg3/CAF120-like PH-like domain-containing protein n=1 Tax=Saccharomycopsis crataegensis TaxID=43959 RepID=A0AAV5QLN5_9ASCO|nr:hypothetical protein DASC09_025800 [Saccharomycopsis crataegensis]
MSVAAAFNKTLNRRSRQPQFLQKQENSPGRRTVSHPSNNLNNHGFLDETVKSPQSPVYDPTELDSPFQNLSVNDNAGEKGYSTPEVDNSQQFDNQTTPSNPIDGHGSSYLTTPVAQIIGSNSNVSSRHSSRNFTVPTSFLRHSSDARVSYIDSSVTKVANICASPERVNNSSARNSTSSIDFTEKRNRRKSFSLISADSTPKDPHHENKVHRLLEIPKNIPQELVPILTLFNSQQARVYKEGYFQLTTEKVVGSNYNRSVSNPISDTISCYGSLSGNELAIWDINKQDFKPIYVNVTDASFTNYFDSNTIKIINPSSNHYFLKFETLEHHKAWFSALILSYFEYNSLHEAYTGALLSAKAVHMNDIKMILAETRYSVGEWCNMKLNYLSSKWIKVYVVTVPKQKDKSGHVDIYSSDKTSNKKNLILTINKGFSCVSVYPAVAEAINQSSELKVEGEITVHNWKFLLNKGVNNNTSILPPSPMYVSHDESSNGTKSGNRSRSSSFGSLRIGRKRSSLSLASSNSGSMVGSTNDSSITSNFPNGNNLSMPNSQNEFTSSLYLIPETHPGVPGFETMVRMLIPLFDAFELYGRPKRLQSNRSELNSLLFALPTLPKSKYLDYEDTFKMINDKISGRPVQRQSDNLNNFANKKKTTTTTTATSVKKKKSSSLLSKFKKLREDKDEGSVTPIATPDHVIEVSEFEPGVPVEQWTNREWLFFLKHELKYKISRGYDGAGHLVEDFESLT